MKLRLLIFLFLVNSLVLKAQWTQIGTPHGLPTYLERIEGIGIIGSNVVVSTNANGIYLTENNGINWRKPKGKFPTDAHFYGSASVNGKLLFGSRAPNVGIFISSDNGENWDTLSNGLSGGSVLLTSTKILGTYNGKLFTAGYNLFVSENDGKLWQSSTNGLPPSPPNTVYAVTNIGTTYFCSVRRVYKSIDAFHWDSTSNIGLPNTQIVKLVSSGNTLVAQAFNTGMYYSEDNGENWIASSGMSVNDNKSVYDIIISNGKMYASTNAYCYVSQDNGKTWSLLDVSGIRPGGVTDLAATNSILYAGIYSAPYGGFFKRVLSASSVLPVESEIPQQFSLSQNFPNPFNPTTTFEFSIVQDGFVTLTVFNVIGQKVASLVRNELTSGTYKVTWDAGGFSSGVYFTVLRSGTMMRSQKIILAK